jgi:hypothetical protein
VDSSGERSMQRRVHRHPARTAALGRALDALPDLSRDRDGAGDHVEVGPRQREHLADAEPRLACE